MKDIMTREEAINEIKSWDFLNEKESEAVQTLIPELSESEDERIRKYLIEELKAAKSVGELKFIIPQPTREECIAYLEKQKEQKPEEWSEEDKLTIADLINYFEGDSLECSTEEMIQRIKSLRPSWKPSEEQMEALARATNRCVSIKDANTLLGLLNQIKNL